MSRGRSKYHAKKVVVDGVAFDSKLEYQRWLFLKEKEKAGIIRDLERQKEFILIPRQVSYELKKSRGGTKLKEVFKEHPVKYKADFVYDVITQSAVVTSVIEDTKGFKTPEYIIKRKLMRFNGNPIREIKKADEPVL